MFPGFEIRILLLTFDADTLTNWAIAHSEFSQLVSVSASNANNNLAYNSSNISNRAIMAHGNYSNEFSISAHQAESPLT